MTPTRAKRNSKAPNRFSSDDPRHDSSREPTSMDSSQDSVTIMNQNSIPPPPQTATGKASKFKPLLREPLKVKLPKLKRPHLQSTKEQPNKVNIDDIKIHKIKLPSFSAKKSKSKCSEKNNDISRVINGSSKVAKSTSDNHQELERTPVKSDQQKQCKSPALDDSCSSAEEIDKSPRRFAVTTTIASKSPASQKLSSNDSSFSSIDNSSKMEIIVSKAESPEGSGIKCPCGVDDDLGVMVECESCSTWQHGHCINVGTEDDAYEGYRCAYCVLPPGKAQDSLYQLTVDDKYQSRFEKLAKRMKQIDSESDRLDNGDGDTVFSLSELNQSIGDLSRVLNSFEVKWKLLVSQEYEAELRIWQNPVWSPEPTENEEGLKNLYIMDRCKNYLELNLRNMLRIMDERCNLIKYSLRLVGSNQGKNHVEDNNSNSMYLDDIGLKLAKISHKLEEFREKLTRGIH